ncbi:MAG: methylated-DNA--[protein]-cysteine S-methyltransferase [Candidatus Micrarchaeia archaeon]|jgi:O-6-methylguanine DNA methyltransferase
MDLRKELEKYRLSRFEVEVLLAVSKIPKGETRSYKEIAKLVGRPLAYRAVGNALKKNPLPVEIPCHRVIRSDGKIGGYSFGGEEKKRDLLERERGYKD